MRKYYLLILLSFLLQFAGLAQVYRAHGFEKIMEFLQQDQLSLKEKVAGLNDSINQHRENVASIKAEAILPTFAERIAAGFTLSADTIKLVQKVDSVQNKIVGSLNTAESKLDTKVGKVNRLTDVPGEAAPKLNVGDDLPATDGTLPGVEIPKISLPELEIPSKSFSWDLPTMEGLKLPEIKNRLSFDRIPDMSSYVQGMKGLLNGDAVLPEGFMGQFEEIGELQRLKGSSQSVLPAITESPSPEKIKSVARNKVENIANGVVADNKKSLKAFSSKASKLKSKYSSLQSIRDIPKKSPNSLEGTPIKERLIFGSFIQNYRGSAIQVDLTPKAHWLINKKWSAGLGYTFRISLSDNLKLGAQAPVFGWKVFTSRYVYRRYFIHIEIEQINYKQLLLDRGSEGKDLYNNLMVGLGKSYDIRGRLSGQVVSFYNIILNNAEPSLNRIQIKTAIDFDLKPSKKQRIINSWIKKGKYKK